MFKSLVRVVFIVGFMWQGLVANEIGKPFVQLGHTKSINSVAITPDGKYALSGSNDDTLKLWDIKTRKEIRTFKGHKGAVNSVAITKDGKCALSGSKDSTLKLWDIKTGKEIRTFKGHTDAILSISLTRDNKYIISGSVDQTIRLWNINTGELINIFKNKERLNPVIFVTTTIDDKYIIAGNGNNTIKIWDIITGKLIRVIDKGQAGGLDGIYSVKVTPNGKFIVSGNGDNSIKIWDIATEKLLKTFNGHTGAVNSVAITKDGKYIISGSYDMTIKLWDIATGKLLKTFNGHTGAVNSVAITKDGKHIISVGGNDKTIRLWTIKKSEDKEIITKNVMKPLTLYTNMNNKYIVSTNRNEIIILNIKTGDIVKIIDKEFGHISSILITKDNKKIIYGSDNHTISIWNIKTKKIVKKFKHVWAYNFSITKDNKYIVFSNSRDINVLDINTGHFVVNTMYGHTKFISSLAITSDDKYIISGSYDQTIKLWNIKTGKLIRTFIGHNGYINSVVVTPNNKYIISGSDDQTIKLWNIKTGKELKTFLGVHSNVNSVVLSSDGKFIINGSSDGTIKYWNINTEKELLSLVSFTDGEWIAITPQGYFNASKNGAKHLNVLIDSMTVTSIDAFYDKFYRPDLVKKALEGKTITQKDTIKSIIKNTPPPKVTITKVSSDISKDEKITTTDKQYVYLTLDIKDTGGGIGEIRILNNGKLSDIHNKSTKALFVKRKSKNKIKKSNKIYLKKGTNNITVVVYNKNGTARSSVESYTVKSQAKDCNTKKTLHAVVIGIDKFEESSFNLNYAKKDATTFANLLKSSASGIFDDVKVTLLDTKSLTSKKSIKQVLKNIRAKPNDTFVFYVSSHGYIDEDSGKYHLITSNFQGESLDNTLNKDELTFLLGSINATNKLILFDTCFSGDATKDMLTDLANPALEKLARTGLTLLSGSSSTQEAIEGYKGHGLFTYTLLEGFKKLKKNNEKVTVSQLGSYVENQVPKYADTINFIQTPLFQKSGFNFEIGK